MRYSPPVFSACFHACLLYTSGSFSFNGAVGARTAERGYQSALNGRGARVVGGGVAQAASTLYLALQQVDGISYDEKKTYGSRYNQDYVESSDCLLYTSAGDVHAVLAERRADRRRGRGLAGRYLQLDQRGNFLCHWGILLICMW